MLAVLEVVLEVGVKIAALHGSFIIGKSTRLDMIYVLLVGVCKGLKNF